MRLENGLVVNKPSEPAPATVPSPERKVDAKGSSKNSRRHRQKKPSLLAMQRLYEVCKEVFLDGQPGIVPSQEDVDRICSLLDGMKLSDVNLTKNMPYFRKFGAPKGTPPVTYIHVYECDYFSIGIFCLPPNATIPLHNHPGMTVFSKILCGSMRIKSYDWADPLQKSNDCGNSNKFQPGIRLAEVKTDAIVTAPCSTSVLYPADGGNMHQFTALTPCAVLDVLGPPYCDPEGRHCTYYRAFPYTSFSGGSKKKENNTSAEPKYAWLQERDRPDDFYVLGASYTGPRIEDH